MSPPPKPLVSSSSSKGPSTFESNDKSTLHNKPHSNKFKYPPVRRDESIVDSFHGVLVSDPYRWLEDPESPETKKFIHDQNKLSRPYLESCPSRALIHQKLAQNWDFPKHSCPFKRGDKYFFFKNTGLQNHSVLYLKETLNGEPKVFFDPNALSPDGAFSISTYAFSEDGSVFAYGLSKNGSDWSSIHFKNVISGETLPDTLTRAKFTNLSWTHDNLGLFYTMYPPGDPKGPGSKTSSILNQKLYYHRMGTDQSEDVLIVEFPKNPTWTMSHTVSDCGKYLIVMPSETTLGNLVYIGELEQGLAQKLKLAQIVQSGEAEWKYVTNFGSIFYFRTNKDAPNYCVKSFNLEGFCGLTGWETIIEEREKSVLSWAACINVDKLVLCYNYDVKNVLELHQVRDGDATEIYPFHFPLGIGTVLAFTGRPKDPEFFYKFGSFLFPEQIYYVDLRKMNPINRLSPWVEGYCIHDPTYIEPKLIREVTTPSFDPSNYSVIQEFYSSKDNTRIPMYILHKKEIERNGENPCLLYGYGGFKVSLMPSFSVIRNLLMEHFDMVIAIANVRGGGEYGQKWSDQGRGKNKQNSFDDFQCAAEHLIGLKYTKPSKLVIQGASNGGLLIGTCINQRPDLFGAAIVQVGVMDMLRFQHFTIGHAWTSEFGQIDTSEGFKTMIQYSPLHNIRVPQQHKNGPSPEAKDEGSTGKGAEKTLATAQYPAVLLLTGEHDDRVVPLHSFKFIAELQYRLGREPGQTNPLLIRIDENSGFGSGKPTSKILEENTDIVSFIAQTLKLTFKGS